MRPDRLFGETWRDELPDGLRLIDLPQPIRGFSSFISAWFFVDLEGRRVLVDPGPAGSVRALVDELSGITDGLDLILLTHIHLDHSGGIGQLCERYPDAKVVVHPRGIKHLLSPEKLWDASLRTLGEVAETYGAPSPLNPDSLADGGISGFEILETPGHAPHHLSFIVPYPGGRLFFVGEAAGLRLPVYSESGLPYLRPATPPKFDGPAARDSLSKIGRALCGGEILCYSHWGLSRQPEDMIRFAGEQLDRWSSVVSGMAGLPEEAVVRRLISSDPLLSEYKNLPGDLRFRERIFIANSVRGLRNFGNVK